MGTFPAVFLYPATTSGESSSLKSLQPTRPADSRTGTRRFRRPASTTRARQHHTSAPAVLQAANVILSRMPRNPLRNHKRPDPNTAPPVGPKDHPYFRIISQRGLVSRAKTLAADRCWVGCPLTQAIRMPVRRFARGPARHLPSAYCLQARTQLVAKVDRFLCPRPTVGCFA